MSYSWMREAHAEAMLLGLGCPFDCCDPQAGIDPTEGMVAEVEGEFFPTREEAHQFAADLARRERRAVRCSYL